MDQTLNPELVNPCKIHLKQATNPSIMKNNQSDGTPAVNYGDDALYGKCLQHQKTLHEY